MTFDHTGVKTVETHELAPILADPEPMWVALFSPQPGDPSTPPVSNIVEDLQHRLQENLRDYDELYRMPNGLFAVVLRTLADASAMAPRLQRVFDAVNLPYVIDDHRYAYRVLLGAAIRLPEETVDSLLNRAAGAVKQADVSFAAPVLVDA